MKKTIILLICCILVLFSSCYITTEYKYKISIVDNGVYKDDQSYHIITLRAPEDFNDLRYSFASDKLSYNNAISYSPSKFIAVDSQEYEGVLVKSGLTVYAIGYGTVRGNERCTFVSEYYIGVSEWSITIEDIAPYALDNSKHIISMTDSSWSGEIYYCVGDEEFSTSELVLYEPEAYVGSDMKTYKGVLIDVGEKVSAVSYKEVNDVEYCSGISEFVVNKWTITLTDYGQMLNDNSKHIVVIEDVAGGDIYYTVDGTVPTVMSNKYVPELYQDKNMKSHRGILIEEGKTVSAISIKDKSGELTSYLVSKKIESYNWEITITNRGNYLEDTSKYLISMSVSMRECDIYYSIDGKTPNSQSYKYIPQKYNCEDSKEYEGVLVPKGVIVKAISYKSINTMTIVSEVVATSTKVLRIGDKGLAGGEIFYDKGFYSDGWRYLEVAPRDLDEIYSFGVYGKSTVSYEKREEYYAVGKGKENTNRLAQYSTSDNNEEFAAKACYEYEIDVDGITYNDWFLPSKDELDLMYSNLYQKGLGNFKASLYWSSSEYDYLSWCQNYSTGEQSSESRTCRWYVRPVRSF